MPRHVHPALVVSPDAVPGRGGGRVWRMGVKGDRRVGRCWHRDGGGGGGGAGGKVGWEV